MNAISQIPLVAQILIYVVAFNTLLSGVKAALDVLKGKNASLDKADTFLGTIISWISKIFDIIGFNPPH